MSSLPIPSAITPALPALSVHPHGHGHKKGSALDPSSASTSNTVAQIPAGSTQNLFGSLFNSLAQLIGARSVPAATAASASKAAASSAAAGSAAAAGAKINVMA